MLLLYIYYNFMQEQILYYNVKYLNFFHKLTFYEQLY